MRAYRFRIILRFCFICLGAVTCSAVFRTSPFVKGYPVNTGYRLVELNICFISLLRRSSLYAFKREVEEVLLDGFIKQKSCSSLTVDIYAEKREGQLNEYINIVVQCFSKLHLHWKIIGKNIVQVNVTNFEKHDRFREICFESDLYKSLYKFERGQFIYSSLRDSSCISPLISCSI